MHTSLDELVAQIRNLRPVTRTGKVVSVSSGFANVEGLSVAARLGDTVEINTGHVRTGAEVIALNTERATVMTFDLSLIHI